MTSFSPAHIVRIDFPATLQPRAARAANDQAASSPRRTVLLGCLALVGVLALGIAARSLNVRPLTECQSGPVRLTLGSETPATVTMGSGAACIISFFAPAASMNDVRVVAAPRHGHATRTHRRDLSGGREVSRRRRLRPCAAWPLRQRGRHRDRARKGRRPVVSA